MSDPAIHLDDKILAQLRQDFLADAWERLESMERAVSDGPVGEEGLLTIRREAHSLKGMGGSFGFPSVTLLAHRLEDYLAQLSALTPRQVADVDAFLDCLRSIFDLGQDAGDRRTSEMIRRLPAHPSVEILEGKARDVEILLITPSRAVSRMLVGELRSLGYRVTTARTPWEAMEMAVCAPPDLVITAAVMDRVNGVDLARAFRAMAATEQLRLALLTSFSSEHPEMRRLPSDVPIIRLGRSLTGDLAKVITDFGLA
ncbi:MAG: Hpt domain-containing protein [Kiloniellaceae bacterium]